MKILISAGPTREKIDPVRFISNRSSGKMGYAIAECAAAKGHDVTLVSGPVSLIPPKNVKVIKVESAAEMACEIRKLAPKTDLIIMAAAVADYTPIESCVSKSKIKKSSNTLTITLKKTEDILASLGRVKKKNQILVGFAAETDDLIKNATEKLRRKKLDWIAANDVSKKDIGFESDENEIWLISADGRKIRVPKGKKRKIAQKILDIVINQNPASASKK